MATENYNLPTITGNMAADVVRDVNALAEATDTAIKAAVDSVDLSQIEQEISAVDTKINEHLDNDASLTKKGHVQLSNSINSTSETLAATPKAVKTAYDRAEQAFTQANDIKTKWASVVGSPLLSTDTQAQLESKTQNIKNILALALNNKGLASSGTEPLQTLASRVENINIGKKWDTGELTNVTNSEPVTIPLDFTPSYVIIFYTQSNSVYSGCSLTAKNIYRDEWLDPFIAANGGGIAAEIGENSFSTKIKGNMRTYSEVTWIAIE